MWTCTLTCLYVFLAFFDLGGWKSGSWEMYCLLSLGDSSGLSQYVLHPQVSGWELAKIEVRVGWTGELYWELS